MNRVKTKIIPTQPKFAGKKGDLDLEAICVFAATGFFLDTDSFWKGWNALPTASEISLDESGNVINSERYFSWRYEPRNISLNEATDEFAELFESIISAQTNGKDVILPLSGGLDSRTQAAALGELGAQVSTYSYSFAGGHYEGRYGKEIATAQGFSFQDWTVPAGYLWEKVDDLAKINECYSEFTHPRQMAFLNKYAALGDVFSLGHWGDVLFDDMGVRDGLSFDDQVEMLLKKIVKPGGLALGNSLWNAWGLRGDFEELLRERIRFLHAAIDIKDNANARIRAFKSLYWAPRWTSVNLSVFQSARPITLPYYDDKMCKFICSVPEEHLAGRKIQIKYLTQRAPKLAKIPWQAHRPFNLTDYKWDKAPYNLPYRAYSKIKRRLSGRKHIQRNWELQFLGRKNDTQLQSRLFDERKLTEWIPKETIHDFYNKFRNQNPIEFSHSVSMLLNFSLFCKHFKDQNL